MSDYTILIRGPQGVILDAEIDATLRKVRKLALDDEQLKTLLVLTSVCAGVVEGECFKFAKRAGQAAGAEVCPPQAGSPPAVKEPPHCAVNPEGRHECCE